MMVFIFLYTQLFQFPFTPIYFEGDHFITISNAVRMVDGDVMYRDFFHFTPPGAELYYKTFFSIFGKKIWVLNFTILWLGLAQAALLWYMSKRVLTGLTVYLPAAIFLVIGFRHFGIDGSYRLFSIIFVLLAAAVLLNKRSPRMLILAGCFCGLASFFVQTRGFVGVAAICVFLLWENIRQGFDIRALVRQGLLLGIPFLAVVVLTHSYFAWQGGFDGYYFGLVTFLQKYYSHDPLSNYSAFLSDFPSIESYLQNYSTFAAISRYFRFTAPSAFFYALIPLIYIVFFVYRLYLRDSKPSNETDARLVFLGILGLSFFAGLSAPTGFRLYHIAIPGVIIFVWLIRQSRFLTRLAPAALVLLAVLGAAYAVQRQAVTKYFLDMPGGEAAFLSEHFFEKYEWIGRHTTPGERLYEAHHPSFYLPFHLVNPTPLHLIRDNGYTPTFQVSSIVESLEKNPPTIIIWHGVWSKRPEQRTPGDNLEPLWQFVRDNYEWQKEFIDPAEHTAYSYRDIEIWKLKGREFSAGE